MRRTPPPSPAPDLEWGNDGNTTAATTNAQNVAAANTVMGQAIPTADVMVVHGAYHYDTTSQTFYPQFPPVSARQL